MRTCNFVSVCVNGRSDVCLCELFWIYSSRPSTATHWGQSDYKLVTCCRMDYLLRFGVLSCLYIDIYINNAHNTVTSPEMTGLTISAEVVIRSRYFRLDNRQKGGAAEIFQEYFTKWIHSPHTLATRHKAIHIILLLEDIRLVVWIIQLRIFWIVTFKRAMLL